MIMMMTGDVPGELDLAEEERLDDLDPLRHLRKDFAISDASYMPPQPHSIINERTSLHFPGQITVDLLVDASPGCGGIAWPAGEVLSKYIARRGSLQGKTVVELGSGTGLVGLVAGFLGAQHVFVTDQLPLLALMEKNVKLNDLEKNVSVLELDWSAPIPADIPSKVDLVLAADCVYFEPAFPLLVDTLDRLVRDNSTEVLFCYKKRRKADKRFFGMLKKKFSWTEVSDDPDRAVYSREAISLLTLTRRSQ